MKTRATTAELVAAMRALHQRDRVRLVEDPFALGLCGWHLRLLVRARPVCWFLINHALRDLRPTMLGVLIRARYAEQALEAAVRDGITQYVIIGAGLDSFALRRPDLMEHLRVFEIDLPEMQALKRKRLRRMGVERPPGLHFVAADLGEVPVMEALATSSFDPGRRAFLSLLGVTYYLPTDVIAATARSIAEGVAGLAVRP
ncbi:class I SAM-dependent methyltransferase [Candidatus Palauibacter sp.]|uniref:class I SAM-dependent methyltransferase n=1 Tax=Candidatus Palauibacter sp. TaxID=3101350 RepID=UPI003B018BDE